MTSNIQTNIYPQRPETPAALRLVCGAAAPAEWVVDNVLAAVAVESDITDRFSQDDLTAILAQYLL
ncbi:MAG TPA: hypothetical protein VFS25_12565 [Chitinophaga sp.]|uniref:hypothetical protein n=1 Tax=Chitinophaga sp. TaxID=1869181 RepID=UPI002DBDD50E|nr:hypothetical protein [Chitinophaga sp.]HEU4553665.1 hypothetical protein [Chitinophaga sp.]